MTSKARFKSSASANAIVDQVEHIADLRGPTVSFQLTKCLLVEASGSRVVDDKLFKAFRATDRSFCQRLEYGTNVLTCLLRIDPALR